MQNKIKIFTSYISLLAKKWILWLFIAFDVLAILIQFLFPALRMPQGAYVSLAIVGVIWAGFETYLDLLQKMPLNKSQVMPKAKIYFVEGNKYSYRFEDLSRHYSEVSLRAMSEGGTAYDALLKNPLPKSELLIHLRIENIGQIPFDILTISGDIDLDKPFNFLVPTPVDLECKPLNFPVRLEPNEFLKNDLLTPIQPFSLLTDAQIAAHSRSLLLKNDPLKLIVFIEISYFDGEIAQFKLVDRVSIRPLRDLYVAHWQKMGRSDLLNLSGYSLAKIDKQVNNTDPTSDINDDNLNQNEGAS